MQHTTAALAPDLSRLVDDSLDAAFAATFVQDPLLGTEASRLISVTNSAVKRHGPLIEAAMASALCATGRFEVVRNLRFPITKTADELVASNRSDELARFRLKFDGETVRAVDVDLFAIDLERDTVFAVDVKRGNGSTELRKRGPIEANLDAVRLLARSYTRQRGYGVDGVKVGIIDYHGLSQLSPRLRVLRTELDDFFGTPVVGTVEAMTDYLRRALQRRMPELMRAMLDAEIQMAVAQDLAKDATEALNETHDDTPVSPVRLPLGATRMARRVRAAA